MRIAKRSNVVFLAFFLFALVLVAGAGWCAQAVEMAGVTFPATKVVDGKTLTLNGVAMRKALGFIKVYVVGLYVEHPSKNGEELIDSEQIKQMNFHYLTGMATAKKLQKGFIDEMKKCNSPEAFERNKADIELYASWLDKDMEPGLTSTTTYVPGKGLTLEYQGVLKGTIANPEFARMYFNYNLSAKADKKIREGLLGR